MRQLWPPLRRHGFDALVVFAAVAAAIEVVIRDDAANAPTSATWFAAPAVALVVLPLLARRRYRFAAPASLWVLCAALSFADGNLIPFTSSVFAAGLVAAFLLGNLRDAAQGRLGLAVVVAGAAIIVFNDPEHTGGEFVFIPAMFSIAWVAGFALRERGEQVAAAAARAAEAERAAEAAARMAVAEERARIARELHDVVAHSMSVMVLQVGAVRHSLHGTHAEDGEALEEVERTGRAALTEMRRLLGAMRRDDDEVDLAPAPGLDGLESLLASVRSAGLDVDLHVDGERVPLPRGLDLSAYRIVQEGLTNALKHARASHADVSLRFGRDDIEIEVRDDGTGAPAVGDPGYGLVGVRERVKIYGGEMSAGAENGGGFVLSARLPLGGATP